MPIDSETKRLKAELEESRAEVERLRVELLSWMDLAEAWRKGAEAQCAMPAHQISEEMRQQMMAQAQAQQQWAAMNVQQSLCNQAQQVALGQGSVWHDCTCVPGRSALLRGDN